MSTDSVQPLSPPTPPPQPPYTYPPITTILIIVLLISFFICFFSVYFCRCFMYNLLSWHVWHSPNATPAGGATSPPAPPGLDKSIVQSFPTFTYSSVKNYRKEKYGLDCAICLVEFDDKDILRLLATCSHVFHEECIDLWLESHKTCPVCRRSLDSAVKCSTNYSNGIMQDQSENESVEDSVSITIKDEHEGDTNGEKLDHVQIEIEKFPRSNSTGHSIVRNREEVDRHTLRLPENVKASIVKGHNSSKSWSTFGEYKNKDNNRHIVLAEISESSSGDINKS